MIEYSYKSRVHDNPLFFLVTEAPLSQVSATLVSPDGSVQELIEYEETAPDNHIMVDLAGKRVSVPFNQAVPSTKKRFLRKSEPTMKMVRPSRWGRRVGARVPSHFVVPGEYRVEWVVNGSLSAVYNIEVVVHDGSS